MSVAALIADLVRAGTDPELVGRVAEALANRESVPVMMKDEQAERRREKDRERQSLRRNPQMSADTPPLPPSPNDAPAPSVNGEDSLNPSHPLPLQKTPLTGVKKGSRLPPDWSPDLEDWNFAIKELGGKEAARRELDRFRDFWAAKAGKDAAKVNWSATWRNWIRKAAENGGTRATGPPDKRYHMV